MSIVFRLVIADVDGTLVDSDKRLTERTVRAVLRLYDANVQFSIVSSRPPRGLSMLIEPLRLRSPVAAFNGGLLVNPDLTPIEARTLHYEQAHQVVELMHQNGLHVWVYRGTDWYLRDPALPRALHERHTVQFAPTPVSNLDDVLDGAAKIVGTHENHDLVQRCEELVRARLGDQVSAARSQPYYLDVTHPEANKGTVIRRLSTLLDVPLQRIVAIGDMPTDTLMFGPSGLSIAMGNASPDVQRTAQCVTSSNDDEGFADAIERFVLRDEQDPSGSSLNE
jgi:Cof subfamily protein (haloacid dehalogenase superfamily)